MKLQIIEKMNKKFIYVFIIVFMFSAFCILFPKEQTTIVKSVLSPTEIVVDSNHIIKIENIDTFDMYYSDKNKLYADKFGITEDEAFIIGNLAKYWAEKILYSRQIKIINNDIIYNKFSYSNKLANSPFGITEGEITNKAAFERQLNSIRSAKYLIYNIDSEKVYPISKKNVPKNFLVLRKSHLKNILDFKINKIKKQKLKLEYLSTFIDQNYKIIVSDLTTKIKPDRNCSSDICKEILKNINNAKNSIDIAIYGYSSVPSIEKALISAQKRGVKIRLVYDVNTKGGNIYPDTFRMTKFISDNINDGISAHKEYTMHNKFYIYDNQIVITGSANLSHTDMSGFNSNSIIVINSSKIAKIYTDEFNQMYEGNFHKDKVSKESKNENNMKIYFSPQDKCITNAIIPIIKKSKNYIYLPSFVITHKELVQELINAKNRGVDIKVIVDALSASNKNSKHELLRQAGILVKTENYAGKMHSKSIIVDDKYLIIGSMNFSNSGENKNDENCIILTNAEATKFYKNFFLYQWNKIPNKWLKYNARAEGFDSIGSCNDGIDNNYDGLIDNADKGCIKK